MAIENRDFNSKHSFLTVLEPGVHDQDAGGSGGCEGSLPGLQMLIFVLNPHGS